MDRVIDGDTITALCNNKKIKIRIVDIDAPEIQQNKWGRLSKNYLESIMESVIKVEVIGTDIYNRTLAIISNNSTGIDIATYMLKSGNAIVYKRYNPLENYMLLMNYAKKNKLGIWSEKGLQQNPQKFRRLFY